MAQKNLAMLKSEKRNNEIKRPKPHKVCDCQARLILMYFQSPAKMSEKAKIEELQVQKNNMLFCQGTYTNLHSKYQVTRRRLNL